MILPNEIRKSFLIFGIASREDNLGVVELETERVMVVNLLYIFNFGFIKLII